MRWLVAALLACAAWAAHAAIEVTDDTGRTLRLAQPPQRIVTLLPSLAETACELGACDRLVGVDSFTNWPASAARLPRVGGVDDANIEAIVALAPDLVLLSRTARALPRLQALGVPALALELKTLADVQRVLHKVGLALGVPQADADAVWRRMNAAIAQAASDLPGAARGTTVYFEVGGGYAASEGSHIGQVLARLGAINVVPAALGTVPKLNPEFVVRADPQLVVVGQGSVQGLAGRPGWSRIRALRQQRICVLVPAEVDVVMRPGPRLAEAARVLARCLRDFAPGAEAR